MDRALATFGQANGFIVDGVARVQTDDALELVRLRGVAALEGDDDWLRTGGSCGGKHSIQVGIQKVSLVH